MAAFKLITVDEINARIAVPENEIGSIFLLPGLKMTNEIKQ
jgi:hypothetical protein